MAKVQAKGIKSLQRKLKKAKEQPKLSVANRVGRIAVKGIKSMTKDGRSPITGRKFPPLKDSYASAKKGKRGRKKLHPRQKFRQPIPNLRLTGDFMKALNFRTKGSQSKGYVTIVGYRDRKEALKEKGHREGAGGQARRPTIPKGKEVFGKEIQEKILEAYENAILRIFRGKGSK